MKWFTRAWADAGGFSVPEGQEAWEAYNRHVAANFARFSDGVEKIVTDAHINGGVIDKYDLKDGVFLLALVAGNDIVGWQWVTFRYSGVAQLTPNGKALDFLIQKPTEVQYDEIDFTGNEQAPYEHRILCWPQGEVSIHFSSVDVEISPSSAAERATFD